MGLIYTFFYAVLFPFYTAVFYMLVKKNGYNPDLKERFVLYEDDADNTLWFHCASVGELNLSKPLIDIFSKKHKIIITVSSPRGKEYAKKLFPDAVVRSAPFDFPFLIKKFLSIYRPKALIIAEGELWYNLITVSSKYIPVISINARISQKSFERYRKIPFFYRKIYNSFRLVIARSKSDIRRINKFLHYRSKATLCGDLKFVSSKKAKKVEFTKKGKILIAGSTHAPEEKVILNVFKRLKEKHPDLQLIIAPRHTERINEVIKLVEQAGFSFSLRSKTDRPETDIYIIDTLGELSGFYRYADVVFIGGTFAPVGGHNILEAVLQNKPVVIGKYYDKIKDMVEELLPEGVVKIAKDENELIKEINNFLKSDGIRTDFGKKGKDILNCYINKINKILEEEHGEK